MNPTQMMKKVAEVSPDKHTFFVKAASEIGKGPFADEVRSEVEGIMKKAMSAVANPSFLQRAGGFAGQMGAAVGTTVAGGIALALAGDMYGAAKRGLIKSRNYKAMLEANPDLREAPADRVQRAFSTLHRLNPEFSGDPTVAGAYVRREAQHELHQWNPQEMKTLIDSHKTLNDMGRLPNFDPRSLGDPQMRDLQMDKLRLDADPEMHGEKLRGMEAQRGKMDADRKKMDMERLLQVEKRINERAAMAAKANAHRPFVPSVPPWSVGGPINKP